MIEIYCNLSEEQADLYHLILSADGLEHHIFKDGAGWNLQVADASSDRAHALIAAYLAETTAAEAAPEAPVAPPSYGSALVAVAVLLVCHLIVFSQIDPYEVLRVYGASARYILIGEYYRTVTALMLHADVLHLGTNLLSLIVLGASVAGIAGAGAGWLLILVAGALGNYINAWIRQGGHLSIGASTAVFAALGFVTGWQALRYYNHRRIASGFWIPVCGGLALLAMLGAGAHTDVMAHVTGFSSGLFAGILYSLLVPAKPAPHVQRNCLVLLVLILSAAWYQLF